MLHDTLNPVRLCIITTHVRVCVCQQQLQASLFHLNKALIMGVGVCVSCDAAKPQSSADRLYNNHMSAVNKLYAAKHLPQSVTF